MAHYSAELTPFKASASQREKCNIAGVSGRDCKRVSQ